MANISLYFTKKEIGWILDVLESADREAVEEQLREEDRQAKELLFAGLGIDEVNEETEACGVMFTEPGGGESDFPEIIRIFKETESQNINLPSEQVRVLEAAVGLAEDGEIRDRVEGKILMSVNMEALKMLRGLADHLEELEPEETGGDGYILYEEE